MEKWFLKNKKANYKVIAQTFGISEILAKLVVNRDIKSNEELKAYLNPSMTHLHKPELMKGMKEACEILKDKIADGSRIRIVGDYDVDGVMSTYILYTGLSKCGANVDFEIPERIKDGYGINISIIDAAIADGIDTIITCDNGIAAIEQVKHAKEKGLTVIITDHHDIPFVEGEDGKRTFLLPEADAVVNPKQHDCNYPFEGICGGVVAYKLVEYLYSVMGVPSSAMDELLEFAAIATVCDVMDLVNENRDIVFYGLDKINKTTNLGLQALIDATGITGKKIAVYHLGFVIGPCINASGRLESAKLALQLFLSKDKEFAKALAKELKELNDDRKEMTINGVEEAILKIEESENQDDKVLVVYLPSCHESLAGIIAGRLKERYHKPTIVLTKAHEGVKGSARSIEEYNMFEELTKCKDLLTKFGGHPMAAGLSLAEEDIDNLRNRLNECTTLTEDEMIPKVSIDMQLPLPEINYKLIHEIGLLEPYGKGNTKPLFALRNVHVIKANVIGKNKNVLKMTVVDDDHVSARFTAMIFSNVDGFEETVIRKYGEDGLRALYGGFASPVYLDLVFYPDINEYNGVQTIQLMIQNYR
ncbi:MAG: single-stranded-DNA-specific exonuclease RecJ [bacterium]|nr:single-stranded-DNA-specific exonuclease RecJ [bacterium]